MRNVRENSKRRTETMNEIAVKHAKADPKFRAFVKSQPVRNGSDPVPTWRRLETYLKRQFEGGHDVIITFEVREG